MNTKEKGFVFRLLVATADRLSGAAAAERNFQTNTQKSKSRQTKKITFNMCRSRWGKWLLSKRTGLDGEVVTFKTYRSRWVKKLLSKCAGLDGGSGYFQNVQV
jgi:hypothetical protein